MKTEFILYAEGAKYYFCDFKHLQTFIDEKYKNKIVSSKKGGCKCHLKNSY